MVQLPIYLDFNATTPCDKMVVEDMLPYFSDIFGNASSRSHSFGWKAEEAVEAARAKVAQLLGAEKGEIIFTSGATESNNLALKGIYERYASKGNHIITTNIEHKAVLDTCHHLEKMGADITYLKVNREGLVDLDELQSAIKPTTILISVIYANNEIGVIQPMKAIGALAKKTGILFFSDATQAVGRIPVHVEEDGIDLLSLSGHKIYGPKGVGALYVRRRNPRVHVNAQVHGGGHERNMRSGTLNVPAIVGLGKACELCSMLINEESRRLGQLRDKLEKELLSLGGVTVNGSTLSRLPNTTNLAFDLVDSNALMIHLQKRIALSSGSACTSGSLEPSHVLKALDIGELAKNSIRFSLGRSTTEEEIEYVIGSVRKAVTELKQLNPQWIMDQNNNVG
ncbi:MAG TPA: IscS subfamily cysteine desulfurase [Chitinophagaceae bacterium]|nr:IscS subfamily cysteine desulfurase [Chitinophagaceae bacterium]